MLSFFNFLLFITLFIIKFFYLAIQRNEIILSGSFVIFRRVKMFSRDGVIKVRKPHRRSEEEYLDCLSTTLFVFLPCIQLPVHQRGFKTSVRGISFFSPHHLPPS